MLKKFFILFFIIVSIANAETIKSKGKSFKIKRVEFSDLKDWEKDNYLVALKSFVKSCNTIAKLNNNKIISYELYNIRVGDLRNVCDIANVIAGTSSNDARIFFENWFTPFLVIDSNSGKNGIFTGYYEASINGSRTKSDVYKYPIYSRPDDLDNKPYFTRKEINDGALCDKNLEIFYTDNIVDFYFLQVQGSGKIILDDGTIAKLSYDGSNNRDYTSLHNIFAKNKLIKKNKINAIAIKEWFKKNPDKINYVLNQNKSYIFFKERNDDYIRGSDGTVLTPFRSIAIDSDLLPYGFPFWIETKIKENNKKENFRRLLISQDTGAAIKGAVRGDIFFGNDERAEILSLEMNFKGKYYILIPNNIVDNIKMRIAK